MSEQLNLQRRLDLRDKIMVAIEKATSCIHNATQWREEWCPGEPAVYDVLVADIDNAIDEAAACVLFEAEIDRGGIHWWHQMRAVVRSIGCNNLSECVATIERQRDAAASNVARWMEAAEIERGRVLELQQEVARQSAIIDELRRLACDECSDDQPRSATGQHADCAAWTDTEAGEAARRETK